MDGRGVLAWVGDVFRTLRGEEPVGAYATETDVTVVSHMTDKTRTIKPDECIAPTGESVPGEPGSSWRRISIAEPVPKLLGRIGCALARSAWNYRDGIVRFLIPVDLRQRRPGLLSTGNLTTTIYVDVTRDSTPDSIVFDIFRQLHNKNDCMPFAGGWVPLDMIPISLLGMGYKVLTRLNHARGLYNASALISNMGRIDTRMFSGAGFIADSVFAITPNLDKLPMIITLVECNGREEIIISIPNDLGNQDRFERLLVDVGQAVRPAASPILNHGSELHHIQDPSAKTPV